MALCWGESSEFTRPLAKERERSEQVQKSEAEKLSTAGGRLRHTQKVKEDAEAELQAGKKKEAAAAKELRSISEKLSAATEAFKKAKAHVAEVEAKAASATKAWTRHRSQPSAVVEEFPELAKTESVQRVCAEFRNTHAAFL